MAFNLGNDQGFYWLDGYSEITSDELLCGYSSETKTAVAEELIRDMLDYGKEVMADEIFRTAESKNISRRTVNEAKKRYLISEPERSVRVGRGRYPNKDCNIAMCPLCIVKNDDTQSHLHCCIVNFICANNAVFRPVCRV